MLNVYFNIYLTIFNKIFTFKNFCLQYLKICSIYLNILILCSHKLSRTSVLFPLIEKEIEVRKFEKSVHCQNVQK